MSARALSRSRRARAARWLVFLIVYSAVMWYLVFPWLARALNNPAL